MNVSAAGLGAAQFTPAPLSGGESLPRAQPSVPFSDMVSRFLLDADSQQQEVAHAMNQLASGQADNVHEIAISVAKADLSFRMVMEVRDQLIQAYQEVMRMQV